MEQGGSLLDLCSAVRVVKDIVAVKGYVKPSYHEGHVVKSLLSLYREGPLGRKLLSKKLGIGETSVRSLVNRLVEKNLVIVDRVAGSLLTSRGEYIARLIDEKIHVLVNIGLYGWRNPVVVRIDTSLVDGIDVSRLRDRLVGIGVEKTVIAINKYGEITVPGLPREHESYREIEFFIKNMFSDLNDTVNIIVYASLKTVENISVETYRIGVTVLEYLCRL